MKQRVHVWCSAAHQWSTKQGSGTVGWYFEAPHNPTFSSHDCKCKQEIYFVQVWRWKKIIYFHNKQIFHASVIKAGNFINLHWDHRQPSVFLFTSWVLWGSPLCFHLYCQQLPLQNNLRQTQPCGWMPVSKERANGLWVLLSLLLIFPKQKEKRNGSRIFQLCNFNLAGVNPLRKQAARVWTEGNPIITAALGFHCCQRQTKPMKVY